MYVVLNHFKNSIITVSLTSGQLIRAFSTNVLNQIVFYNIGFKPIKQHLPVILFYKNLSNNYRAQPLGY
jgi:hypothetical protein